MGMPRPRIGICSAFERAQWGAWDREAFLTPTDYVRQVQRSGGLAVLLPPDPAAVTEPGPTLDVVDALMLAGGADMDPATYGQRPGRKTVGFRRERDDFEIALVRAAIERDMPLLGICRGMQVLNVAFGGTLIQHLPDRYGHGDHRRSLGSFENSEHDVRIADGTLAQRVIGQPVHVTYSHHHQGIDTLGEGLLATGWSTLEDLVEVIEVPGKRFVLGVQWHPEADAGSPVVGALVEAAAASVAA